MPSESMEKMLDTLSVSTSSIKSHISSATVPCVPTLRVTRAGYDDYDAMSAGGDGGTSCSRSAPQTATPSSHVGGSALANPLLSASAVAAKIRDATAAAVSTVFDSATSIGTDRGGDTTPNKTPNEYRNLLISLSGQKSDHILWIECLKQYHWEGDKFSEFDFELDMFGVPNLKNGDYTLNLCYDCLDLVVTQQQGSFDEVSSLFEGFSYIWEGNYWDSGTQLADDIAHLSGASMGVVVRKCANVLNALFRDDGGTGAAMAVNNDDVTAARKRLSHKTSQEDASPTATSAFASARGRAILAYMPNVVQLFAMQMAAARIGAVFTFVNASIHSDPADLARIIDLSGSDTIFTVDGFFIGEQLRETKKILDDAINILHSDSSSTQQVKKVVMVRHVSANPNLPSPIVDPPLGRRPHYGLEVPFHSGRDFHWSNLMLEASEECACEWMQSEDLLFRSIRKVIDEPTRDESAKSTGDAADSGTSKRSTASTAEAAVDASHWQIESYTVGQIALLVRLLARTLRSFSQSVPAASGPVWALVDSDDLLFLSTTMAVPLAGFALLMCEGSPTNPSPTRIFEIVEKHDVKQMLIGDRYVELLIRNDDFHDVCYQEGDPNWSTASLEMLYMVSGKRRANESGAKWLQTRVPTAHIMHLCC